MVNVWLVIWGILDFASVNVEPPNHEIPAAICEYEEWGCKNAIGVVWCESLMSPTAVNSKSDDHGVMQVNRFFWADVFGKERWAQRYDYHANIEMGIHIWEAGGWKWEFEAKPLVFRNMKNSKNFTDKKTPETTV